MTIRVLLGDCIEVMKTLPDASVDSIVTDPPAGIGFMGKGWDSDKGGRDQWIAWMQSVADECLRVLKPGGHALVWALPRTSHWTATAWENAGFEVRERVAHLHGAGFPKSYNLDRLRGTETCGCTEQTVPYTHGISSQEVRSVRSDVDSEGSVSGDAQSGMQSAVRHSENEGAKASPTQTGPSVQMVWEDVSSEEQDRTGQGKNVQLCLSGRDEKFSPGMDGAHATNSGDRSPKLDRFQHGELSQKDERAEQSGLEGRRNSQATEGELQGGSVRSRSDLGAADGTEGRLHHGASSRDGATLRVPADTHGSGGSPGPQPGEQRPEQSAAVPNERGPQTWRGWPLCERCGKPILPKGLGTALKPAMEDWWLLRKPLAKGNTVAANVLAFGTGGLNIDASRVPFSGDADEGETKGKNRHSDFGSGARENAVYGSDTRARSENGNYDPPGRWPANLIHDGSDEVLAAFPQNIPASFRKARTTDPDGLWSMKRDDQQPFGYTDTGSAARFFKTCKPDASSVFYTAKASGFDRNDGTYDLPPRVVSVWGGDEDDLSPGKKSTKARGNHHPTVKPTELMRYLCRLITPAGGTVLDPFMGSGSTLKAAELEGFSAIGIELDPAYVEIARRRIASDAPLFAEVQS